MIFLILRGFEFRVILVFGLVGFLIKVAWFSFLLKLRGRVLFMIIVLGCEGRGSCLFVNWVILLMMVCVLILSVWCDSMI